MPTLFARPCTRGRKGVFKFESLEEFREKLCFNVMLDIEFVEGEPGERWLFEVGLIGVHA